MVVVVVTETFIKSSSLEKFSTDLITLLRYMHRCTRLHTISFPHTPSVPFLLVSLPLSLTHTCKHVRSELSHNHRNPHSHLALPIHRDICIRYKRVAKVGTYRKCFSVLIKAREGIHKHE